MVQKLFFFPTLLLSPATDLVGWFWLFIKQDTLQILKAPFSLASDLADVQTHKESEISVISPTI